MLHLSQPIATGRIRHPMRAVVWTVALFCLAGAISMVPIKGYTTYARWVEQPAFLVNPANADGLSAAAVEAAILTGLDAWNSQSGSAFHGSYGGRVTDTSTANDGRNVILFRDISSGSTIASTYSWWDANGNLLDSDVVFWDGGFTFFAGAGCGGSNAAYIEDIAAHEFGHTLGLNHSAVADATMYPSYSTCSISQRTLASDDIAGAQSLYPLTNTAPVVTIASPSNGTSVVSGVTITFSGTAVDQEVGVVAASLVWTSSVDGQIGVGATFTRTLSAGSHTIVARATDGSLFGSAEVNLTVVSATTERTLTARGYKVKTSLKADLTWNGIPTSSVDVYRNGVKLLSTTNDGTHLDTIGRKGTGTWTYKVCDAGSITNCSNSASVTF